jgi:4-hydroxybenzoate polyprenyltransferase
MIWQTNRLLTDSPLSGRLSAFVFFSTICSYNFHWWLTPDNVAPSYRVRWTQHNKILHFILYLAGATGAVIYFFSLRRQWPALCLGALLTFLYSAPKLPQPIFAGLKKIAVGKTIFLALVWMYVTTMLPVFVAETPWTAACTLYAINRFGLIYAICIIFDYRDREDDRSQGIKSLITIFNEKGIDAVFWLSLGVSGVTAVWLYAFHYSVLILAILLIPGLIVGALYKTAKKSFSDYLYYFILDGLMMFSGLLMLVFRI